MIAFVLVAYFLIWTAYPIFKIAYIWISYREVLLADLIPYFCMWLVSIAGASLSLRLWGSL